MSTQADTPSNDDAQEGATTPTPTGPASDSSASATAPSSSSSSNLSTSTLASGGVIRIHGMQVPVVTNAKDRYIPPCGKLTLKTLLTLRKHATYCKECKKRVAGSGGATTNTNATILSKKRRIEPYDENAVARVETKRSKHLSISASSSMSSSSSSSPVGQSEYRVGALSIPSNSDNRVSGTSPTFKLDAWFDEHDGTLRIDFPTKRLVRDNMAQGAIQQQARVSTAAAAVVAAAATISRIATFAVEPPATAEASPSPSPSSSSSSSSSSSLSGTSAVQETQPRSDWPSLIDREKYQEWDDTDLGMPDLFYSLNVSEGLQQRWALLLVDAILCNQGHGDQGQPVQVTLQALVVETFDRHRLGDCFAEKIADDSSVPLPNGIRRYKRLKICKLPGATTHHRHTYVTIGTTNMSAVFTAVVLRKPREHRQVQCGPYASGFFEAQPFVTRLFLSKESINMARTHVGSRFPNKDDSPYTSLPVTSQLRSFFSHFEDKCAYKSARAATKRIITLTGMPATVFTLANFGVSGGMKRASRMFLAIAEAMVKDPYTAVLKRQDVERIKGSGELGKAVEELLGLFGQSDEQKVLANDELDKKLRAVAKRLAPVINAQNQKLEKRILD